MAAIPLTLETLQTATTNITGDDVLPTSSPLTTPTGLLKTNINDAALATSSNVNMEQTPERPSNLTLDSLASPTQQQQHSNITPSSITHGNISPALSSAGSLSPSFLPEMPQWKRDLIQRRKQNVQRTISASSPTSSTSSTSVTNAATALSSSSPTTALAAAAGVGGLKTSTSSSSVRSLAGSNTNIDQLASDGFLPQNCSTKDFTKTKLKPASTSPLKEKSEKLFGGQYTATTTKEDNYKINEVCEKVEEEQDETKEELNDETLRQLAIITNKQQQQQQLHMATRLTGSIHNNTTNTLTFHNNTTNKECYVKREESENNISGAAATAAGITFTDNNKHVENHQSFKKCESERLQGAANLLLNSVTGNTNIINNCGSSSGCNKTIGVNSVNKQNLNQNSVNIITISQKLQENQFIKNEQNINTKKFIKFKGDLKSPTKLVGKSLNSATSSTTTSSVAVVKKKMVAVQDIKKSSTQSKATHLSNINSTNTCQATNNRVSSKLNVNKVINMDSSATTELDNSEDLSYGPGIVSKLRCRYLSLALRESMEQQRLNKDQLRRSTSLNNLLDNCDEDEEEDEEEDVLDHNEEEAKADTSLEGNEENHLTSFKSKQSSNLLNKKMGILKTSTANNQQKRFNQQQTSTHNVGVTFTETSFNQRSRHLKRGNDSLKRARSVEALLSEKSPWHGKTLNTTSANVTIEDKIHNARERLQQGIEHLPPKRLTSIIDDTERPPPDLVKQTLKMFEASANRRPRNTSLANAKGEVASKVETFKNIIKEQKPLVNYPKPLSPTKKLNSSPLIQQQKPLKTSTPQASDLLQTPLGRKTLNVATDNNTPLKSNNLSEHTPDIIPRQKFSSSQKDFALKSNNLINKEKFEIIDSPVTALTKELSKMKINETTPIKTLTKHNKNDSDNEFTNKTAAVNANVPEEEGGGGDASSTLTSTSTSINNQQNSLINNKNNQKQTKNESTQKTIVVAQADDDEVVQEEVEKNTETMKMKCETVEKANLDVVNNYDSLTKASNTTKATLTSSPPSTCSEQSDEDDIVEYNVANAEEENHLETTTKRITRKALDNIAKAGYTQQFKFNNSSNTTSNNNSFTSSPLNCVKQIGVIKPLQQKPETSSLNSPLNTNMDTLKHSSSSPLTSREIEKNRINDLKKSSSASTPHTNTNNSSSSTSPQDQLQVIKSSLHSTSSPVPSSAAGFSDVDSVISATNSPLWAMRKRRQAPPAAPAENTSMVFNFSNRKEVPDYIENDGVIFRRKRELPKPNESGFVLLGDLSVETSTDMEYDDFSMCPPSPCDVEFVNANIVIDGKSSIRQKSKDTTFRVQFNDTLTSTFEYPSEASLIVDDSFTAYNEGYTQPHGSTTSDDFTQAFQNMCLENAATNHQHHVADEIIQLPPTLTPANNSSNTNNTTPSKNILGNLPLDYPDTQKGIILTTVQPQQQQQQQHQKQQMTTATLETDIIWETLNEQKKSRKDLNLPLKQQQILQPVKPSLLVQHIPQKKINLDAAESRATPKELCVKNLPINLKTYEINLTNKQVLKREENLQLLSKDRDVKLKLEKPKILNNPQYACFLKESTISTLGVKSLIQRSRSNEFQKSSTTLNDITANVTRSNSLRNLQARSQFTTTSTSSTELSNKISSNNSTTTNYYSKEVNLKNFTKNPSSTSTQAPQMAKVPVKGKSLESINVLDPKSFELKPSTKERCKSLNNLPDSLEMSINNEVNLSNSNVNTNLNQNFKILSKSIDFFEHLTSKSLENLNTPTNFIENFENSQKITKNNLNLEISPKKDALQNLDPMATLEFDKNFSKNNLVALSIHNLENKEKQNEISPNFLENLENPFETKENSVQKKKTIEIPFKKDSLQNLNAMATLKSDRNVKEKNLAVLASDRNVKEMNLAALSVNNSQNQENQNEISPNFLENLENPFETKENSNQKKKTIEIPFKKDSLQNLNAMATLANDKNVKEKNLAVLTVNNSPNQEKQNENSSDFLENLKKPCETKENSVQKQKTCEIPFKTKANISNSKTNSTQNENHVITSENVTINSNINLAKLSPKNPMATLEVDKNIKEMKLAALSVDNSENQLKQDENSSDFLVQNRFEGKILAKSKSNISSSESNSTQNENHVVTSKTATNNTNLAVLSAENPKNLTSENVTMNINTNLAVLSVGNSKIFSKNPLTKENINSMATLAVDKNVSERNLAAFLVNNSENQEKLRENSLDFLKNLENSSEFKTSAESKENISSSTLNLYQKVNHVKTYENVTTNINTNLAALPLENLKNISKNPQTPQNFNKTIEFPMKCTQNVTSAIPIKKLTKSIEIFENLTSKAEENIKSQRTLGKPVKNSQKIIKNKTEEVKIESSLENFDTMATLETGAKLKSSLKVPTNKTPNSLENLPNMTKSLSNFKVNPSTNILKPLATSENETLFREKNLVTLSIDSPLKPEHLKEDSLNLFKTVENYTGNIQNLINDVDDDEEIMEIFNKSKQNVISSKPKSPGSLNLTTTHENEEICLKSSENISVFPKESIKSSKTYENNDILANYLNFPGKDSLNEQAISQKSSKEQNLENDSSETLTNSLQLKDNLSTNQTVNSNKVKDETNSLKISKTLKRHLPSENITNFLESHISENSSNKGIFQVSPNELNDSIQITPKSLQKSLGKSQDLEKDFKHSESTDFVIKTETDFLDNSNSLQNSTKTENFLKSSNSKQNLKHLATLKFDFIKDEVNLAAPSLSKQDNHDKSTEKSQDFREISKKSYDLSKFEQHSNEIGLKTEGNLLDNSHLNRNSMEIKKISLKSQDSNENWNKTLEIPKTLNSSRNLKRLASFECDFNNTEDNLAALSLENKIDCSKNVKDLKEDLENVTKSEEDSKEHILDNSNLRKTNEIKKDNSFREKVPCYSLDIPKSLRSCGNLKRMASFEYDILQTDNNLAALELNNEEKSKEFLNPCVEIEKFSRKSEQNVADNPILVKYSEKSNEIKENPLNSLTKCENELYPYNSYNIPKPLNSCGNFKRLASFEFDADVPAANLAALSLGSPNKSENFENFEEKTKETDNPTKLDTNFKENQTKTKDNLRKDINLNEFVEIKQNSLNDRFEKQDDFKFMKIKPIKSAGNLKIPEIFDKTSSNNEKSVENLASKHNLPNSAKERRKTREITPADLLQMSDKPKDQISLNNMEPPKLLKGLNLTLNPLYLTDYKSQITQNLPPRNLKTNEISIPKTTNLLDSQESLSLTVKNLNEYSLKITENFKYQSKSQDNLSLTTFKTSLKKSSISNENIVNNSEYSLYRNNKTNSSKTLKNSPNFKEKYMKMKLRSKSVDSIESTDYNLYTNKDQSKSVNNLESGFNSNDLSHNLSKSLDNIDSSTKLDIEEDFSEFKNEKLIRSESLTKETLKVCKTKIPLENLNRTLQMSIDSLEAYEDALESWPNDCKDLDTSDNLEAINIDLISPLYDYHNLMSLKKSKTSYCLNKLDKSYSLESQSTDDEDNFVSACNTLESKWSQKPAPQIPPSATNKSSFESSKKSKTFRVKTTEKLITLTQMAQHNVSSYATFRKSKNFCKNASKSFKNSLKFYENFGEKSLEKITNPKSPIKRSVSLTENALKRAELNRKIFAEKSEKFIRKVRNLDEKESPTENSDSFEYFETEDGRQRKRKTQSNKNDTENVDSSEINNKSEENIDDLTEISNRNLDQENFKQPEEEINGILFKNGPGQEEFKDITENTNFEDSFGLNPKEIVTDLSKSSAQYLKSEVSPATLNGQVTEVVANENSNKFCSEIPEVKVKIFNSQNKTSVEKLKRLATLEMEVNNIDKDLAALYREYPCKPEDLKDLNQANEVLKQNLGNSLESNQNSIVKDTSFSKESLNSKELKTKISLDEILTIPLEKSPSNNKPVSSKVNYNTSPRPFKRFEENTNLTLQELNTRSKPLDETNPLKSIPSKPAKPCPSFKPCNLQSSTNYREIALSQPGQPLSAAPSCIPESLARFHCNKAKFNVYSSTPTKHVKAKTSIRNSKPKESVNAANHLSSEMTPLVVTSSTISTVLGAIDMGITPNSFERTQSFSSPNNVRPNFMEKFREEENSLKSLDNSSCLVNNQENSNCNTNSKVIQQISNSTLKLGDNSIKFLENNAEIFEHSLTSSNNFQNSKSLVKSPEISNPFPLISTKSSLQSSLLQNSPTKMETNLFKLSSSSSSNMGISPTKSFYSTLAEDVKQFESQFSNQIPSSSRKTYTERFLPSSQNSPTSIESKMETNLLKLSSTPESYKDICLSKGLAKDPKYFNSKSQQFEALSPKKQKFESSLIVEGNYNEKSSSLSDLPLNFPEISCKISDNSQISKSCSELEGNSCSYPYQMANPKVETFVRRFDSKEFSFDLIKFSQNSPKIIDNSNDNEKINIKSCQIKDICQNLQENPENSTNNLQNSSLKFETFAKTSSNSFKIPDDSLNLTYNLQTPNLKVQTFIRDHPNGPQILPDNPNYSLTLENSCKFREYLSKSPNTRQVCEISKNFEENISKFSKKSNSIEKSLPKLETFVRNSNTSPSHTFNFIKFSQNSTIIPDITENLNKNQGDNANSLKHFQIKENFSNPSETSTKSNQDASSLQNSQIKENSLNLAETSSKSCDFSSNLCNLAEVNSNEVESLCQVPEIVNGNLNFACKEPNFVRNSNSTQFTQNSPKFSDETLIKEKFNENPGNSLITIKNDSKILENSKTQLDLQNFNSYNASHLFASFPCNLGNIAQFPNNKALKDQNATTCSDTFLTSNTFNSATTTQLNKTTTPQLILNNNMKQLNNNNFNKTTITTLNNNTPPTTITTTTTTTTTTKATTPILRFKDFNETTIKVTCINTITTNSTCITTNFPTKVVALNYNNSTNISDKNSTLCSSTYSSSCFLPTTTSFLNKTLATAKYQQHNSKVATTTATTLKSPTTTKNPPNVLPRSVFNNTTPTTTTTLKSCKTTTCTSSNLKNNQNNNAPPLPPLRRRIPGSAPLGFYTPLKAPIDRLFQLGVTRAPSLTMSNLDSPTETTTATTTNGGSRLYNGQNGGDNDDGNGSIVGISGGLIEDDYNDLVKKKQSLKNDEEPESLQYIKPADDDLNIAYSEGTQKTDLLY